METALPPPLWCNVTTFDASQILISSIFYYRFCFKSRRMNVSLIDLDILHKDENLCTFVFEVIQMPLQY